MREIIRTENLSKTYPNGVASLKGISLTIQKGEMVGIMGASGSGKTTLFRLLNGSLHPSTGEILVFGQSVSRSTYRELRKLRAKLALIYQHHNIVPGLSVARNVLIGKLGHASLMQLARMSFYLTDNELTQVHKVLEELGIGEKIFVRATDLSGGQQQRVAVARALMSGAPVLLADEPIASVDSNTAETILNLFRKLNREQQTTIIMNLHQKDFALNYCSRVIILEAGRIVYDGLPERSIIGGRVNANE